MNEGWRTAAVQGSAKMYTEDGQLRLRDVNRGTESAVPLDEVSRVVLMCPGGVITVGLLRELAARKISLVLCDRKYNPAAELACYAAHEETAGALMDQAAWTRERRDALWADVVRCKLRNQIRLLELTGCPVPPAMREYLRSVLPGDPDNREAAAARLYFRALFGPGFRRHAPDAVNGALNYGYALLCSGISRALTLHGYHTALGMHHCSRANRFNLSCDLMEPFRPFVDRLVFGRQGKALDLAYRQELILSLQDSCVYDGRRMTVDTAMETFTRDTVKALTDGRLALREVGFE